MPKSRLFAACALVFLLAVMGCVPGNLTPQETVKRFYAAGRANDEWTFDQLCTLDSSYENAGQYDLVARAEQRHFASTQPVTIQTLDPVFWAGDAAAVLTVVEDDDWKTPTVEVTPLVRSWGRWKVWLGFTSQIKQGSSKANILDVLHQAARPAAIARAKLPRNDWRDELLRAADAGDVELMDAFISANGRPDPMTVHLILGDWGNHPEVRRYLQTHGYLP